MKGLYSARISMVHRWHDQVSSKSGFSKFSIWIFLYSSTDISEHRIWAHFSQKVQNIALSLCFTSQLQILVRVPDEIFRRTLTWSIYGILLDFLIIGSIGTKTSGVAKPQPLGNFFYKPKLPPAIFGQVANGIKIQISQIRSYYISLERKFYAD